MKRIGLWIVGAGAIAAIAIVVAFLSVDTRREATIPLDDVAEGVTYRTLGQTPVFFVRSGDRVEVIVARSTHLREPLHWCVRERVFYDPRVGGDLFDERGRKVKGTGPAPRDLDSLAAKVEGESLVVRTHPVVMGRDLAHGGGRGMIRSEWRWSAEQGIECRQALPPR